MSDIRALVRAAFSAGFQCCRAYGDNHAHFDGEQKDRVMATYLDPLLAAFDPEPGTTPLRDSELVGSERSAIKETLDPLPLSFRAQVIQAGEDVTSAPGEYLPDAMMVAAARTALLIAKGQMEYTHRYGTPLEIIDSLLTALSGDAE